ncbi:MAG: RNA polymerase sigma factor [Agathobaculum sp.]|jgi:RNA polymerase sigma factor (sigma-70 family)|uniref:RNA polymerase sigma factor n=1 Tax=Agathobaculum sp. TaxID=2048138 RepID=UPI003D946FA1
MMKDGLFDMQADRAAYQGYLSSLASDNSAFRAAFRETFFRAMREQLTARQYEVLWLSEVDGLSGKEIAYKLGISQSAVSRHRTRGKRKLRVLLSYNLDLQHEIFDGQTGQTRA